MAEECQVFVPRIDYPSVFVIVACMACFAKGAELDERSKVVWAGLSLGVWLAFTQFFIDGIVGGLVSQVLLFVGLTVAGLLRERRAANRR